MGTTQVLDRELSIFRFFEQLLKHRILKVDSIFSLESRLFTAINVTLELSVLLKLS